MHNSNGTEFFSRNNSGQNANKFQNQPKSDKIAVTEINDWYNKNKDTDIKIKICEGNKFILSLTHNGEHLIEITYPKSYPENKKGFACKEILTDGITPIKFIKKANDQFENKILSIERVIDHLVNAFNKYKQVKKSAPENDSSNSFQVVFKANNVDDLNSWSINNEPSEVNTIDIKNNNDQPEIEMINLDPTEVINQHGVTDQDEVINQHEVINQDEDKNQDEIIGQHEIIGQPRQEIDILAENVIKTESDQLIENIDDTEILSEEVIKLINYQSNLKKEQEIKDESIKQMLNSSIDIELINKILLETENYVNESDDIENDMSVINSIYNNKNNVQISNEIINVQVSDETNNEITNAQTSNETINVNNNNETNNETINVQISNETINVRSDDDYVGENQNDIEFDDRPSKEELFDLGSDVIFVKNKRAKRTPAIQKKSNNTNRFVTSNKIFTSQDFDDFVTKNYQIIENKHPSMEEDEIMDIIQRRWKKELSVSKKRPQRIIENDKNKLITNDVEIIEDKTLTSKPIEINDENNENNLTIKTIEKEISSVYDKINSQHVDEIMIEENIEDDTIEVESDPETNDAINIELSSDDEIDKIDSKKNVVYKKSIINNKESNEKFSPEKQSNEELSDNKLLVSNTDSKIKIYLPRLFAKVASKTTNHMPEKPSIKATKTSAKAVKTSVKETKTSVKETKTSVKETEYIKLSSNQLEKITIDDDVITFGDVEDNMGIYLNLCKYTKNVRLPFDMDKLFENAKKMQDEMDFCVPQKSNNSFSSASAIRVVLNEFKKLYYAGLRNNYSIFPVDDNIYRLKIKFNKDFFDSTSKIYNDIKKFNVDVEIDVQLDGKLYPFYPPKVKLVSPRLLNHMNGRIATMECLLLSKWNPAFSIETIIGHFKNLMDQYAEIDTSMKNYDELENELIELSLLSEIPARINYSLTTDGLKNIKDNTYDNSANVNNSNIKKCWTSGTGYGHKGLAEWDVTSTVKAKERKDKQLSKCIKNITRRLTKIIMNNIDIDSVGIISNSCFIPYLKSVFCGNNILELLKNLERFELLLNSLRILTNEYIVIYTIKDGERDLSLYEIFDDLNDDCQMYLKTMKKTNTIKQTNESKSEINLVSNFVNFCQKLGRQIKNFESENLKKQGQVQIIETEKTLREIYRAGLADESCAEFNEMDINDISGVFNKLRKEAGEGVNTQFISINSMSIISKEILSHTKSLPLEYGSSIFYRFNPDDLRYHEFMIAGPEGTPYDSGCFHFKMYCPSNYPDRNPKVNICTTGNGLVRFNPNLYSNGKVCLSLLGTWNAQASESWIPGTSTMMQIMISIQSLVMIPEPYFNEPGFETTFNTNSGKQASIKYNYSVRLNCMKWAMIDMLKNPTKGFETAIKKHFTIKAEYIRNICSTWVSEAPKDMHKQFDETYKSLCEELDKLSSKKNKTNVVQKKINTIKKKSARKQKIVDI
jgi:ubiquitin-protein ligase